MSAYVRNALAGAMDRMAMSWLHKGSRVLLLRG